MESIADGPFLGMSDFARMSIKQWENMRGTPDLLQGKSRMAASSNVCRILGSSIINEKRIRHVRNASDNKDECTISESKKGLK